MERFSLINKGEILLWGNILEFKRLVERIDALFKNFPETFKESMNIAQQIKECILKIDPFIDFYSKKVCSSCTSICCLNKNSRYEYDDLIYILALREIFPIPERNLQAKEPCYLLTEKGCKIPRYIRPSRCNWYFCKTLLNEMESAPAKVFREFSNTFNLMLYLKQKMLNSFFQSLSNCKGNI